MLPLPDLLKGTLMVLEGFILADFSGVLERPHKS